jgi:hypothetical protein
MHNFCKEFNETAKSGALDHKTIVSNSLSAPTRGGALAAQSGAPAHLRFGYDSYRISDWTL